MLPALRIASTSVLASLASLAPAQQVVLSAEDYLRPPAQIEAVLTADGMHNRTTLTNLSPDGEHFLITVRGGMAPLANFARPYVNLGETAIDHRAMRARSLSVGTSTGYDILSHKTGERISIELPEGILVSGATWSPKGKQFAFLGHSADASHIYIADLENASASQLTDRPVLATLMSTLRWTSDGKRILAVLVPEDQGPLPERDPVAHEPSVWLSHDGKTSSRTYRFLLKTPYDKDLLEHLSTGQLCLIDVQGDTLQEIGKPAMFTSIDIAPDSAYFRVSTMQRPFSYFVTRRSFGSKEELWNRKGEVMSQLRERKLRVGSRPTPGAGRSQDAQIERRSLTWRPDGRGMTFLQKEPKPKKDKAAEKSTGKSAAGKVVTAKKPASTKGAAKKAAKNRPVAKKPAAKKPSDKVANKAKPSGKKPEKKTRKDRLMHWLPPYKDGTATVIWESDDAISSVSYSADCKRIYVTQSKAGKRQVFAVDLAAPTKHLKIIESKAEAPTTGRFRGRGRSARLLTKRGRRGGSTIRSSADGKYVYVGGTDMPEDPTKAAPRPYLDRITIGTAEKKRLWQSSEDAYETIQTVLDDELASIIIGHESPTEIPDSYLLDLETGKRRQLTHNIDPAPAVTSARRLRIKVKRVDGFEFWVKVTIPRDYGKRLPALFWFYPREFTDQKSYDARQKSYNKNRFPTLRTRSMEIMTLCGYVVVQPDCPIVGEAGKMNNNFIADLRNSLWAVIDDLDKREIIDRDRLAIGGHSYGAFGTANALAHTPFFKAGIAGDGNYNRTLTPMSFQAERRYLWDARETYFSMSPLMWANQINGALLMYHGADDNNTGTFPINSPRMFQALDGLGKRTALYMYPYEGHGPGAEETILDLWSRWVEWLDIYVKDPDRGEKPKKKAPVKNITEFR